MLSQRYLPRTQSGTHGFVSLKEYNTTSLVSGGEIISRRVKLDCGYDIGWGKSGFEVGMKWLRGSDLL
jgi:hypothetical protein